LIKNILEKNYDNYLHFKNIKNCYKNINEINILIKIEKEDLNKQIYFLDNGYGKNENGN